MLPVISPGVADGAVCLAGAFLPVLTPCDQKAGPQDGMALRYQSNILYMISFLKASTTDQGCERMGEECTIAYNAA